MRLLLLVCATRPPLSNKWLLLTLVFLPTALAGKKELPCDRQSGARLCKQRNVECNGNIKHQYTNKSSPEYLHETCPCVLQLADCFERIECNGTNAWNNMVLCNGVPNCTGCPFFASASTVLPAFVLVAVAVLFAVFF